MRLWERISARSFQKLVVWNGTCVVHEEITTAEVKAVREEYPTASILAHPECRPEVVQMADFTGSTEQMLDFFASAPEKEFLFNGVRTCRTCPKKNIPKKGLWGRVISART